MFKKGDRVYWMGNLNNQGTVGKDTDPNDFGGTATWVQWDDGNCGLLCHSNTYLTLVKPNLEAPAYYTEGRKYEPRLVVEDWDLNFYLGSALKYISRAGRKGDAITDLKKAIHHLTFEIERLEKNG